MLTEEYGDILILSAGCFQLCSLYFDEQTLPGRHLFVGHQMLEDRKTDNLPIPSWQKNLERQALQTYELVGRSVAGNLVFPLKINGRGKSH